MSAQLDYISRATHPDKKKLLQEQWDEAHEHNTIHCCCGQLRAITHAYRCLYCGLWFCVNCAEVHFGMTLQQWIEKKRVEKRQELKNSCTLTIDLAAQKCKHSEDEQIAANNRPV